MNHIKPYYLKEQLLLALVCITFLINWQTSLAGSRATGFRGEPVKKISINAGEFIYKTDQDPTKILQVYSRLTWFPGNQKAGFYLTQPKDWDQKSDIDIILNFEHSNSPSNITLPSTVDWIAHLLPLNPGTGDSLLDYEQLEAQSSVTINTTNINSKKSQKFTIPANHFAQYELWGVFFERGFESAYPSEETLSNELEVLGATVIYAKSDQITAKNMFYSAGAINLDMNGANNGDYVIEETFDNALRWNKTPPYTTHEGGIRFRTPVEWDYLLQGRKVTIYYATASPDSAQTVNWRMKLATYEDGVTFPKGASVFSGDQPTAIPAGGYGRVYSQTFDLPVTFYLENMIEIYFTRGSITDGETHSNPLRVLGIDVSYLVSGDFNEHEIQFINPAGLTIFKYLYQTIPITMVTQDYLLFPKTVYHRSYWYLTEPSNWDDSSDVLFRVYFAGEANPDAVGAVHWNFSHNNGDELLFMNPDITGKLLYQDFCTKYERYYQADNWDINLARDVNSVIESYDDDLYLAGIAMVYKQQPDDYIFSTTFEDNHNSCQAQKVLLE